MGVGDAGEDGAGGVEVREVVDVLSAHHPHSDDPVSHLVTPH